MILIPFLFFAGLTAYWWRKHSCIDICVYMSGLYALISLLAMVILLFDLMGEGGILMERDNMTLGIIPTLLFCACIGLCLLPFSMIYGRDIKRITINAPRWVDALSVMLILVSLLNLYLVADSTMDILQGDLAQIRNDHYAGEDSPAQIKAETMNYVFRLFYYFNVSTILCLPLFFYNVCFHRKRWWWNGLLFFASLSAPIGGIQVADRTEIAFWGLMLLFCIVFFYPFFSKKLKWGLTLAGLPIILAFSVYFVAVSQARFDTKSSSSSGDRALQYTGQGYLNFCYFYENANFDYLNGMREFPFVNHFVFHKDSNSQIRDERSGEQGFFISVFSTFIGDVMLDLGVIGMVVWVIAFFMIGMLLIRRAHREEFDLSEVLLIYVIAIYPVFGIFYYRMFFFTYTLIIFLVVGLRIVSHYKLVAK